MDGVVWSGLGRLEVQPKVPHGVFRSRDMIAWIITEYVEKVDSRLERSRHVGCEGTID